ncbi:hypothetical protein [Paenibacillus ferrarius]|nr:hypothetical protein [Paenibacillus ferrarius]
MNQIKDLQKLIKLTGDRAKLDAKANDDFGMNPFSSSHTASDRVIFE